MDGMFDILTRALLGFALLLLLIRIIGNKQLGQLNVFTYISGIAIGSMAGEFVLHKDIPLLNALAGITFWAVLTLVVEMISLKSVKARELLDGQPIILIKKGKIIYDALKKERLNIDDLTMMLRTNMVFSITEVEYAILESDGDLNVLKKHGMMPLTRKDLNIVTQKPRNIPTAIIMDGKIVKKSLVEQNLTLEWLYSNLNKHSVFSEKDVLYAEIQEDGGLYIQLRSDENTMC